MGKLVNLRTARKQRARDAERRAATATDADGAEAERARAAAELERRRVDGHHLDAARRDDPEA
jgi:hypothetical protein